MDCYMIQPQNVKNQLLGLMQWLGGSKPLLPSLVTRVLICSPTQQERTNPHSSLTTTYKNGTHPHLK